MDELALLKRQPATLNDMTTVNVVGAAPRSEDEMGV
tara:strand:- start:276 stop:383 length:108 start_codon:yes stop_codon:yes gene_type:complete